MLIIMNGCMSNYEGSTVVFLLNVIVTNGCMSITRIYCFILLNVIVMNVIVKNLLLYYIE